MNYPKVSIIVLNWNGLKDTIECLESLKKITYPNYEMVVVDNGSEGNDADVLEKRYKDYVKVIRNKDNLGWGGGNNRGMEYAIANGSNFLLILNNDMAVEKSFLEPLVEDMLRDEKIGIIGPANYHYYEPQKLFSSGKKTKYWGGKIVELSLLEGPKEVDSLAGCCLLVKKEVIDKIGCFYEPYFLNSQETDYCLKADKRGFKIVCEPKSKVWHKIRATLDKIPAKDTYYYYRSKLLFIKRNAPFYMKYPLCFCCSLYLVLKFAEKLAKKDKLIAFSISTALIDFWRGKFSKKEITKN